MKRALIVFAREPKLGKVKTRLARAMGKYKVLALYKAFICDVLAMVARLDGVTRFIYYTGGEWPLDFLGCFKGDFFYRRQYGDELGKRLLQAVKNCQDSGFDATIIIGSDCLDISPKDIEKSFQALKKHDLVIGPSKDGGYYLIGMKRGLAEIFKGIKWSSQHVFQKTMILARKSGLSVCILEKRADIDNIANLWDFYVKYESKGHDGQTIRLLRELNEFV